VSKIHSYWTAAVMVAAFAGPAVAQEPSSDHVKALIQQAMGNIQGAAGGQGTEGVQMPATSAQGPRVDLTSDQAVALALEKNLALQSQRLTPRTFDYAIAATAGAYRPVVTSLFSNNSQTSLPNTTIDGGDRVNTDTNNWNANLTQNLRWGGASYQVLWNNNRVFSTRNNSTFNPAFGSTFRAQYTQPLLQNFRIDNTRTNLLTQEIQQDVAELDLQAAIESTTAQVRNAYWELAYAILNVEAQRQSLDLATKLVQDNGARVEIGTMAPIDVVQAQAEEATRRAAVVNAEALLRNNELGLKRLIVSGTDDPLWTSTINAVDRPGQTTEPIDLEGALRTALGNRTDLATARKNIDAANITLRSFDNQTLPQLNLVTSYQLDGRGGKPVNTDLPPGGWFDALNTLSNWDAPTWNVQVNFSYPLGTSAADANKARQQLIIQQNQTQIKATELQIATEVTAAALAVRNSLEALQAASVARTLSQQRADAAQSKLDVGMATNFEVVQAQRDLADARNRELREALNYRRALVDFQRVQVSPR
jgi:outer membrane protein TolC